jgi:hypothetical protein
LDHRQSVSDILRDALERGAWEKLRGKFPILALNEYRPAACRENWT